MRRAVSYCLNDECSEYTKGVFLLNHGDTFKCAKCTNECLVVGEKAKVSNKNLEFGEVRVEYNYDPLLRKYREVAIVKDENAAPGSNVLTLWSPLIKTDKRALRVAESYLAQMMLTPAVEGEIPSPRETILNFDKPLDGVKKELEELHYRLFYAQNSKLQKSS